MSPSPSSSDVAAHVESLFDAEAVRRAVAALGARIEADLGDRDPLLLALLGGSVIFFADLVRAFSQPVRFEFVDVGYHLDATVGPGGGEVLSIRYPVPVPLEGQTVLVLKDVVSSGVTEPYLEQQLRDRGAREVRFAALVDIPDARKTEFRLQYSALTAVGGGMLVGYGLKHQGRYGNLPFLGRLVAGVAGN
jgi:hypoxanthine phosphoribosyltransferase